MADSGLRISVVFDKRVIFWYINLPIEAMCSVLYWGVVELVRRLTLDQEAVGSSPTSPAKHGERLEPNRADPSWCGPFV